MNMNEAIEKLAKLLKAKEQQNEELFNTTCDEITKEEWEYIRTTAIILVPLAESEISRLNQTKIETPKIITTLN